MNLIELPSTNVPGNILRTVDGTVFPLVALEMRSNKT